MILKKISAERFHSKRKEVNAINSCWVLSGFEGQVVI